VADVTAYDPVFEAAGNEWNVDPQLLKAMAIQESGGRTNAVSKAGALGVMQIMPDTAKILGITDPTDPVQSIYGAAKYMNRALDKEGSVEDALRNYHGGDGWRQAYGDESRNYVPAVTKHYQMLGQFKAALADPNPSLTTDAAAAAAPAPATPTGAGKAMASDDLPSWLPPAPTNAAPAAKDASDGFPSWLPPAPKPSGTAATPEPDRSILSRIGSAASDVAGYGAGLIGAATKGLSFGLSKPLDQATAALFPGSGFAKLQPQREQAQQAFETANPLAAGAAQVAGSLPTYMMGEGALRAVVPVAQAPGVVSTGANLLGSAARNALVSGAEAAGTADGSVADRLEAAKRGAVVGAVAGPAGDVAGAGVQRLLGGGVSAADATLGQLARQKYGIPITAADMSGNQFYRTATDQMSKLPFSGAGAADAAKRLSWQSAIAKQMGEDASQFTDDVMSRAKTRIGKEFDGVAQRTTIDSLSVDALQNDLAKIETDLPGVPMGEGERNALKANMENITKAAAKGDGTISGDDYQALTRAKTPLDLAESSQDPNVRHVAGQIRDTLDDAFARSASPQDQAALQQARYQYRVMRTVQDLAAGSRDGNISPDAFMQKVLAASRRFDAPTGGMAYTGGGDIGELARIGKLMRAAPDSGTADRALINALALGAGGIVPTLAAHPLYGVAAPAAVVANNLAGRALRSGWAAKQAIQNTLNPGYFPPAATVAGTAAGVNALNRP
jgi:hypothetical protein